MPIPNRHKRTPLFLLLPHDATGNGGNSVERRWQHGVNDDGNKVVTWWNDGGNNVALHHNAATFLPPSDADSGGLRMKVWAFDRSILSATTAPTGEPTTGWMRAATTKLCFKSALSWVSRLSV